MNSSRLDYALNYFDHGFIPVPVCWTKDGQCACPRKHTGRQIGKAPLIKYNQGKIDRNRIEYWFGQLFPNANIAINLEDSKLVVIDADSEEAVNEIEMKLKGMNIPTVKTNRGKHYYFKMGESTPHGKTTQKGLSKKIDIMSTGLMTVPPSTHASGHVYQWITTPKAVGVPNLPGVIEQYLLKEFIKQPRLNNGKAIIQECHYKVLEDVQKIDLETLPLSSPMKHIIQFGEQSKFYQERNYESRSEALFGVMVACVKAGLDDEVICSLLMDRKNAISEKVYEKGNGKLDKMLDWLVKLQLPKAKMKANKRKKGIKKRVISDNDSNSITISKGSTL